MGISRKEVALKELEIEQNKKKVQLICSKNAWIGQFRGADGSSNSSESDQVEFVLALEAIELLMKAVRECIGRIPEDIFANNPTPQKLIETLKNVLSNERSERK